MPDKKETELDELAKLQGVPKENSITINEWPEFPHDGFQEWLRQTRAAGGVIAPLECLDPDLVKRILAMYVEGMSVEEVAHWAGTSIEQVNAALDSITPYI